MVNDSPEPFKQSLETQAIIARLKEAKLGELVSYHELETLIGAPVDGSHSSLRTAIIRLGKDEDKLFKVDRTRGVVWLKDEEIVNDALERTRHVRRYSKHTIERAQMVAHYSSMSPDNQRKHSMLVGVNAVVAYMTKPKQLQKIEASIPAGTRELPVSETLKMFTSRPKEE